MWFKNLKVFRLSSWTLSTADLCDVLEKKRFQPASAGSMQSIGWVPPREDSDLAYPLNGQILLAMRSEKKLLPSAVIKDAAQNKARQIEEQQGYKPGRKQMKEIKEQVTDELLPKAFSVRHDTRVWIDTANHWLAIDTTSATKSDEVLGMLAKCIDPFPVCQLYVKRSPASAMTSWLESDEAPAGFTIDQDSELRSTSQNRATVRYVRQSIAIEQVRKHVQDGKQCTRLALTWADKVSFVLNDLMDIKRVTPLDILTESKDVAQNEAERFDSDFTLMTGELSRLLADLIDGLDGEKLA
ncbi:MAG: recombination-associated protein RdgC [Candidimonas sp.]|nr:MAG: recombination-associated protein RdgC [Candidimonas sp.]TAM24790.1 MAG: recombination-associated protein RdgC [Candidimonas sp.]